jgi:DNA-binding transcriptional ArsR family regulator
METSGRAVQLADAFAALGNQTRLAIVERLLREGELAAGDIVAEGTMSAPAMSHHFKVLRDAGILVQRVDAQRRLYSVRPEAMRMIGGWTLTYRQFWQQSLDRLGAALKKEKRK